MGGRGSSFTTRPGTDGRYPEVNMGQRYRSTEEMVDAGFRAVNDFSLSSLLRADNIIGEDVQPWNNRNRYYIWDEDFKRWILAAERRY